MVVSPNEINLYRMLVRCEQRLNDNKSEWNNIEKGKFVAVRFLILFLLCVSITIYY